MHMVMGVGSVWTVTYIHELSGPQIYAHMYTLHRPHF